MAHEETVESGHVQWTSLTVHLFHLFELSLSFIASRRNLTTHTL